MVVGKLILFRRILEIAVLDHDFCALVVISGSFNLTVIALIPKASEHHLNVSQTATAFAGEISNSPSEPGDVNILHNLHFA